MLFVLGEIFSLLAAISLCYSTFNREKKKMVYWQVIDSLFNTIANLFLLSYSGCITSVCTMIRNLLQFKNKNNKITVILFCITVITLVLIFNNKGFIGLLPAIGSIEYTLFLYNTKSTQALRIGLIINLMIWCTYDCYVKSYPMFAMDLIIIIVSFINIIRYRKNKEVL